MLSLITYFLYITESYILHYFDYLIHENNIPNTNSKTMESCQWFRRFKIINIFRATNKIRGID